MCVYENTGHSLFSLAGMATNNKLPLFWSSWVQFPVQHDFPVSLSGLSERVDRGMKWIFVVMILDATFVCWFPHLGPSGTDTAGCWRRVRSEDEQLTLSSCFFLGDF